LNQSSAKWLIALPFAGAEWQAHTSLLRHGVKSFLPYLLGSSRRGRWNQGVVRPLFPGYVFAELDGATTTEQVRRSLGIRELLRGRDGLIFMSPSQIADLRKAWLKEYRAVGPRLNRKQNIKPGDFVAVPYGPLQGVPAQVEAIDKSGTISACIGSITVTFSRDAVQQTVRASA
jgi:transcription antitermination factor NusG